MSDEGYSNPWADVSVLVLWLLIAAVIVLTYFFGWIIPLGVVLLLGALSIVVAIYEKRFATYQSSQNMDDDGKESEFADAEGNCKKCGSALFVVEPMVTTAHQIANFAKEAEGWKENPEALNGWMPPGIYCSKGCVTIHSTPVMPGIADGSNHGLSNKLVKFEDLLELTYKAGKKEDVYTTQEIFMGYYRRGKRKFMASMPMRHRYQCQTCGKEIGEAELYFEDPSQPISAGYSRLNWGEPSGRFYATLNSTLHNILFHGDPVPDGLAKLCDGIKG